MAEQRAWNRWRAVRAAAAVATGALMASLAPQAAAASSGLAPTAGSPFTSVSEFIGGFPTNSGLGPIGLLDDGSHFFVTDYPSDTMYRFPVTGGSAASPELAVANGLNSSMVVAHGVYYATTQPPWTSLSPGLYTFDPNTLAQTGQVMTFPAYYIRQVAADPLNVQHLYVSTDSGIFMVDTSTSPATRSGFGPAGNYDGMEFTADGTRLYVAQAGGSEIFGFDRSGKQLLAVSVCCNPDGIAVAKPNTVLSNGVDVSNNVFVNTNGGTIERIDVNNGNAVTTVASGGTRGDFITVGPDGTLYVTQTDDVLKLQPAIFQQTVDTTPPAVSCGTPDGLWHASDVSVACSASDSDSGLANAADASFSLSTNVPAGTETANAATGTHEVCDKAGNCATAGPIAGNKVDKKAPSIAIAAPAAGATYTLNSVVTALYSCSDGGSGVATCAGTVASGASVPTGTVGSQSFTVSATDNVGNASSQSAAYTVSFGVCALYDQTRAMPAGSVRPIKLELCDASGNDASSAATTVHATGVTMLTTDTSAALDAAGNANPDNDFRFDSTLGTTGGYIYNLSTTGYATGTYRLTFTANGDPAIHSVQFELR